SAVTTDLSATQASPGAFQHNQAWQRMLSHFNRGRLVPGLGDAADAASMNVERQALEYEKHFLAKARAVVAPLIEKVPQDAKAFVKWFERLQEVGPGQKDPLFPLLADHPRFFDMKCVLFAQTP